ncbi:hypothetical protein [Synechococcus sp. PCC 7336]|uniref:hypothetical protein n=1 Tax=Synechococcus sp. PCC 7336 TaxID=195250 RepID=UPI000378EB4C|nr:hypothetical protein [Synechococcus sp. PCC 7336]
MNRQVDLKRIIFLCVIFLGLLISGINFQKNPLRAQPETLSLSLVEVNDLGRQQPELCQALEAIFSSISVSSQNEFWCRLPKILEPPLFTQPSWEKIDASSNYELARELFLRTFLDRQIRDIHAVERLLEHSGEELFEDRLNREEIDIETSSFDVDLDGDPDRIYRYSLAECSQFTEGQTSPSWIYSYHILDEDNLLLSDAFLRRLSKKTEAFFFGGRTYLLGSLGSAFGVYEAIPRLNREYIAIFPACIFQFVEKSSD